MPWTARVQGAGQQARQHEHGEQGGLVAAEQGEFGPRRAPSCGPPRCFGVRAGASAGLRTASRVAHRTVSFSSAPAPARSSRTPLRARPSAHRAPAARPRCPLAHNSSPVAACWSSCGPQPHGAAARLVAADAEPASGGRSPEVVAVGQLEGDVRGLGGDHLVDASGSPRSALRAGSRAARRAPRPPPGSAWSAARWCRRRAAPAPTPRCRAALRRPGPSSARPGRAPRAARAARAPGRAAASRPRRAASPVRRSAAPRPTSSSASSTGRAPLVQPAHIRTVSATVSSDGKPPSWSITPVRGRTAARSVYGSCPSTRTLPPLGGASPSRSSTVEVLPAPLVPSSAKSSPRATEKEIPETASKPPA